MGPLARVLLQLVPDIIDELQKRHAANNPDAPPPTAEEINAAFEEVFTSTIAKDEAIRAALKARGIS